jgi:hypothetical protein
LNLSTATTTAKAKSGSRTKAAGASRAGASLAGAGGGTLLVLLARALPDGSPWKPWATLLAPTLSVTMSAALLWLTATVNTYFRIKRKDWFLNRIQANLEKALDNPRTSAEHKDKLRKHLEELEIAKTEADLQLIKRDL